MPKDVKVGDIEVDDPELQKAPVHNTQTNEVRSLLDRRQLRLDQSTNFVGAREFAEALKEMNPECLKEFGCEFIMNTPSASHMGGI